MNVTIATSGQTVILEGDEDIITIHTSHPDQLVLPGRADFAAWIFLPIAMRKGCPLHIQGCGSSTTISNAQKLSRIWQKWVTGHFESINVSFSTVVDAVTPAVGSRRDLCLYSGGIDSTYSILDRHLSGLEQDLLTVHGMDYKPYDIARFERFIEKTAPFASYVGRERIVVRQDAYSAYNRHKVNLPNHHISHIFALAGAAFLHAKNYTQIHIAADSPMPELLLLMPWGSNSLTNPLFDSGDIRLVTDSESLTRCEKTSLLLSSKQALDSLSFCVDYNSRPANCGRCTKCQRTKLMFLARTGTVPNIFADRTVPIDWLRALHFEKIERAAISLFSITNMAIDCGNSHLLPDFDRNRERVIRLCSLRRCARRRREEEGARKSSRRAPSQKKRHPRATPKDG
jgi:hypothetical protein